MRKWRLASSSSKIPTGAQNFWPTAIHGVLPSYWGNEWDFYWTSQPLAPHEGDSLVRHIDAEEARELDSHPIVTFGMWAENPARRLYDSRGYVHGGGQIIADSAPFGPH